MREAVIVIADLYLDRARPDGADEAHAAPALEHAARFGERATLEKGWRPWLARWLGQRYLASISAAQIAAASLPDVIGATHWIATPVELVAGLTRVHLDPRGILRLTEAEQLALVDAFDGTFGDAQLAPLPDGQLLLTTAVTAVATSEPARCVGRELEVPQGPAAAPLLRLMAELEMWLHVQPLNDARRARGARPVTGLWLWGAGRANPPMPATARAKSAGTGPGSRAAFGTDAYLAGLCTFAAVPRQPLPAWPATFFAQEVAERVVLVTEMLREWPQQESWSLAAAAASLDRRFIAPALEALRQGRLDRLILIANDTRVTLGRHSGLRFWRRARPGLAAFASA